MNYRSFRDTGKQVSLLGLGCMRFPRLEGRGEEIDYDKAEKIIDHAYKNGVNYFDTAYVYNGGDSERVTGRALSKYPRESYMLASKMPGYKCSCEQDVYDTFQESLSRCGVEYFDFYLLHDVNEGSIGKYDNDYMLKAMDKLRGEGKIRHLGFSSHGKPEFIESFAKKRDWDFAQIQLNYLDWTFQDAKRQYEILAGLGIPVIVMEPVRGGRLASLSPEHDAKLKAARPDRSIASWAINWVIEKPAVLTVLSGMNEVSQVEDNLKTVSKPEPISAGEQELLDAAVTDLLSKTQLPCTGCRYCVEDCPQSIGIPEVIEIYNRFKLSNNPFHLNPLRAIPEGERPSDCVACRACEGRCPQGIEISAVMEELSRAMSK